MAFPFAQNNILSVSGFYFTVNVGEGLLLPKFLCLYKSQISLSQGLVTAWVFAGPSSYQTKVTADLQGSDKPASFVTPVFSSCCLRA